MSVIKYKLALRSLWVWPCLGVALALAHAPARAQAAEAAEPTVRISQDDYLTDSEGRTLYLFAADSEGASNCNDFCANTFPPYTIEGNPVAGEGMAASRLGTLERENGETQVTYAGHPLYYYVADTNPGSTAADGAKKYGAEWSTIALGDDAAAEATTVAETDTNAEANAATSNGANSTAQAGSGGGNPFAGDAEAVAAGEELYSTYGCYGCHGRGGGGGMGPSLIDGQWNYGGGNDSALFKSIAEGRPRGMPAFGGHFTEEQMWKIVAFLRSISNASEGAK